MLDALKALLKSRKFLLLVLDTSICVILYFAGKYAGESTFEDVKLLIFALQPVFVSLIMSIAHEDGEKAKALGDKYLDYLELVK